MKQITLASCTRVNLIVENEIVIEILWAMAMIHFFTRFKIFLSRLAAKACHFRLCILNKWINRICWTKVHYFFLTVRLDTIVATYRTWSKLRIAGVTWRFRGILQKGKFFTIPWIVRHLNIWTRSEGNWR